MKKNCQQCEKEYQCRPAKAHISRFCSVDCRCDWEKINGRIRLSVEDRKTRYKQPVKSFVCVGCEKKFKAKGYKKRKYCSRQCGAKHIGEQSHDPWNKGLSKENDERISRVSQNHSEFMKKKYASGEMEIWNKGLTAESDDRMAKMVESQTIWRNKEGPEKEAWKDSMRKAQVEAWSEGKYSNFDTKPELLTKAYLESKGFTIKHYKDRSPDDPPHTWYQQYPFENKFNPDFTCPDLKSIIEVDGCYVHDHDIFKCAIKNKTRSDFSKQNAKRDRKKHWFYNSKGWKWANVWECEAERGNFHRIEKYLEIK